MAKMTDQVPQFNVKYKAKRHPHGFRLEILHSSLETVQVFPVKLYRIHDEKDGWKTGDECEHCSEHHRHVYVHVDEATSLKVMFDEHRVLVCMRII